MYIKHEDKITDAYLQVISESKACCNQKPNAGKPVFAVSKPKVTKAAPTGKVIKEDGMATTSSVKAEPIISTDDIGDDEIVENDIGDIDSDDICWCTDLRAKLEGMFDYSIEFNEDENILEVIKAGDPITQKAEIELIKENVVLVTCGAEDDDCCEEFGIDEVTAIAEFITDCFENIEDAPDLSNEDPYTGNAIEESYKTYDLSKEMEEAEKKPVTTIAVFKDKKCKTAADKACCDKFVKEIRHKLTGKEKDISYWMKKDIKEFCTFVNEYKSKRELKKEPVKESAILAGALAGVLASVSVQIVAALATYYSLDSITDWYNMGGKDKIMEMYNKIKNKITPDDITKGINQIKAADKKYQKLGEAGPDVLPTDRVGAKGWLTDNDSARRTANLQTGIQSTSQASIPNTGAKTLEIKIAQGKPIAVAEFEMLSPDDQIKYITNINFKIQPTTKSGKMFDYKSKMKPETRYWYWEDMSETGAKSMKAQWDREANAQPKLPPTAKDFGTPVAPGE